ncbi:MAG: hypothetical protein AAFY20_24090 [Cyanobacteria bacterium J06639_14]
MPEDQGDIVERLRRAGTLTDNEIQHLSRLLKQSASQDASQPGKFNISVSEGTDIRIGDLYNGTTVKEIRAIIQELLKLQSSQAHPTLDSTNITDPDKLPLARIVLDPITLETINARLDIIQEIFEAGCFSETQQKELNQLKRQLHTFYTLNQDLRGIAAQGDRLIQSAVADMRQQLADLQLRSEDLTAEVQAELSPKELECRQAENQILENFVSRLEDSRLGADWINQNMKSIIDYACKQVFKQFSDSNISNKQIEDFQFSLRQFLEQVSFCLYWGNYSILDSPEIPFELDSEHYEAAFQAMKKTVSPQLRSETTYEIEACLDYLIKRLPFINAG